MTKAKSLLLGSAAALATVSGAQAADLGLPVAAVNYVQICSIGSFTGFLLPGSDVCLDIGGFARFEVNMTGEAGSLRDLPTNYDLPLAAATITAPDALGTLSTDGAIGSSSTVISSAALAAASASADDYDMGAEANITLDARTMTEWGLLRGFLSLGSDNFQDDDETAEFEKAFLQIGGLTAGVTDSFFDPIYTDYAVAPFGDVSGAVDHALIGYTMAFGNGFTFMLSLENDEARQGEILSYHDVNFGQDGGQGILNTAVADATSLTAGTVGQGGSVFMNFTGYDDSATMPDIVAALRVDQAWGSAKLSAALHEIDPAQAAVDSEIGYAVGASAEFNLPVGTGSTFGIFGNYAVGAVQYVGFDTIVGGQLLPFADAVYNVDENDLDLTTAYGLGAGVDIGLGSGFSWQFEGYYTVVDHEDVRMTILDEQNNNVNLAAAGEASTVNIDLDGSIFSVRSSVTYVPFAGLTMSAGVSYQQYDFDSVTGSDDDEFGARLRITRSF